MRSTERRKTLYDISLVVLRFLTLFIDAFSTEHLTQKGMGGFSWVIWDKVAIPYGLDRLR